MNAYYPSAQKADRLVAVELCYNGTVRPMERAPQNSVWQDVTGVYQSLQVPKEAPLTITAEITTASQAMCCIETSGWYPPYIDCIAYFMGQSWAFGKNEVDYANVANSANDSVRKITFTFASDGTLSWSLGTGPTENCSFQLDQTNLKFAYVVLRVTDKNSGSLTTPGLAFKLADGTGAAKSTFSC
jgi:hypothetical protein